MNTGDLVEILEGKHKGRIGMLARPPFEGCDFYVSVAGDYVGPYLKEELLVVDEDAPIPFGLS